MARARPVIEPAYQAFAEQFEREWWANTETKPEDIETPELGTKHRNQLLRRLKELRVALARELEDAKLRFVQAWKRGDRPKLLEFVGTREGVKPREKRLRLFRELLRSELQLHMLAGPPPPIDTYRRAFPDPDYASATTEVFEQVTRAFALQFEVTTDPDGAEVRLGGGGEAVVVLGRDLKFDREVAIKRVNAKGEGAEKRLWREARTLAHLEEAGVPTAYGVGKDRADRLCLAEQLIRGRADPFADEPAAAEQLTDRIDEFQAGGADARRRNPAFLELIATFINVCRTVAAAHKHRFGIIHRDLKPENILLDANGRAFVVDWGLAAWTNRAGVESASIGPMAAEMTSVSRGGGTAGYLSPEQAAEPERASWLGRLIGRVPHRPEPSAASDVFGLGACLFKLLTGVRVYDCDPNPGWFSGTRKRIVDADSVRGAADQEAHEHKHTPEEQARRVRELQRDELMNRARDYRRAPDPRALNRHADPELCDIVRRAIAPRPDHRYQDAGELTQALEDWLRDNSPRHPVGGFVRRRRYRYGRWVRRNTGKFVLATLVLTVLAAGGGAWWGVRAYEQKADAARAEEQRKRDAADAIELDLKTRADRARERARDRYSRLTNFVTVVRATHIAHVPFRQNATLLTDARDQLAGLVAAAGDSIALDRLHGDFTLEVADARLKVAKLHHLKWDFVNARKLLTTAVQNYPDPLPAGAPHRAVVAETYWVLGDVLSDLHKYCGAIKAYDKAVTQWEALTGGVHENQPVAAWHARTLGYRGDSYAKRAIGAPDATRDSDFEAARRDYAKSLELRELVFQGAPDDPTAVLALAHAHNNLARLNRHRKRTGVNAANGEPVTLDAILNENFTALVLQQQVYAPRGGAPPGEELVLTAGADLAGTLIDMGEALILFHEPGAAEGAYRRACELLQRVGVERGDASTELALARARTGLLRALIATGSNAAGCHELAAQLDATFSTFQARQLAPGFYAEALADFEALR